MDEHQIGTSSCLSLNYDSVTTISKKWMITQVNLLTHKKEDGLESTLILVTLRPRVGGVLQRKQIISQLLGGGLDFSIFTRKWDQRVQTLSVDIFHFLMYLGKQSTIFFSFNQFSKCLKWGRFCILVVDVYSLFIFFALSFIVIHSLFFSFSSIQG